MGDLRPAVDLLWNGGIGTYGKAPETHAESATRPTTDPGNGPDCGQGVGEGGNLGLTQRGRIEFARSGGRIYTDFIDNTAGVDCSDHEVNIKILLGGAVADGELSVPDRDALLAAMTDEVARWCCGTTTSRRRRSGNARSQAHSLLPVHRRMLTTLEEGGQLNRELEALPRTPSWPPATSRRGLAAPEFAVSSRT
jgi:glutamate dehydrogenase